MSERCRDAVSLLAILAMLTSWGVATAGNDPAVESGRALIEKLGCPVCHEIPGLGTTVRQEAPDLTFEGDRVRPEWLFSFLRSPHPIRPAIGARMLNFRLTDAEAVALTEALMTFRDASAAPLPPAQRYRGAVSPATVDAARKLMSKEYLDCFNCHWDGDRKPAGQSEEWAPDLSQVPGRLNPDWIVRWLKDPQKVVPNTKMPAFFADDTSGPDDILGGDETAQILAIRDYLVSRGRPNGETFYRRTRAEHPEADARSGRSLLVRLNCVGCHRIAGFPQGKHIGPKLAFQGSRVKREWLTTFLRRPGKIKPEYAIMGSDARMPDFRFADREIESLVEYIMTVLTDPDLRGLTPGTIDPGLVAEGERLFAQKFCDNCHRIGSRPGGIGPDLTEASQRLNPAWVYRFVLNPSHYLDTRMPNLRLTEAEARAVTSYLMFLEREP